MHISTCLLIAQDIDIAPVQQPCCKIKTFAERAETTWLSKTLRSWVAHNHVTPS
jgi:hypothetical protein